MTDFLGSGWKYPISVENTDIERNGAKEKRKAIAISKDDQSIQESIMIILSTAKGERVMRPEFGCDINRLVFEVNNVATMSLVAFHITQALKQWEPRIQVLDVQSKIDEEERNKLNITIDYVIKTSNTKANMVYPFYLEGKGA